MASTKEFVSSISSTDIKLGLQNKPEAFSNVPLGLEEEGKKKKKVPRRILHFSDGTLEEYSTDEEEEQPPPETVNPKTLKWGPWFWYYVSTVACKSLGAADFLGEKLAWFFGITSPKYQYAIDEYEKLKAEEEEERKRMDREVEAERQRETDRIDNLEGGMPMESVYIGSKEVDSSTPQDPGGQMHVPKQGIDNPGLKY